jgi:hypothetical protein
MRGNLQYITDEGKGTGTRRMTVATRRKIAGSDTNDEGEEGEVAGEGRSHGGGRSGERGGIIKERVAT